LCDEAAIRNRIAAWYNAAVQLCTDAQPSANVIPLRALAAFIHL